MIKVVNLSKTIGKRKILDSLNFELLEGHIYGFVGPNGSGKTTLLNAIIGFTSIDNKCCLTSSYSKSDFSFVGDIDSIDTNLTGREFIILVAGVYGMSKNKSSELVDLFASYFSIHTSIDNLLKTYSHGMIKKTILISQLILNRKIMIFDEPTNGLDAESILCFEKYIKSLDSKDKIIIISSHNLDLVERLITDLIVIDQGHIKFKGTIHEFRNEYEGNSIHDSWFKLINKNTFYEDKLQAIHSLL